jgi:hypothetical protein
MAATAACGNSDSTDKAASEQQANRDKARQYYVERVHIALNSCVQCHAGAAGTKFMAVDAEESYSIIEKTPGLIAAPASSPLIKYVHQDKNIAEKPEQRSILTQWLSLEANARGLPGAVEVAKTVNESYANFARCMNTSYSVWTYYRMGDLPFAQTDAEGPCMGCHSTGQGSAFLSAGSRETFEQSQKFPYIQKYVVGKLDDNGSFEALQPSKRFAAKSDEVCPPDSTSCHPRFGLDPWLRDRIDGFVATILERMATNTCSSPLVVPADGGTATLDGGADGGKP